ncbi:hypothetical protein [Arabidopsis thaliana]|uniref:Uncharacterized protein AT4g18850 n=2 Tax=Arabidopsis TaxID=3701 RepID=O49400_ARATH|nr:hypothetical protein ISN44_As04g019470 [Arabidopsis suecica]CAA16742.1 hypothetical protein [Arabidopsis thaliana]CAB78887.1 hypothetical protein [Arabidopsis thaliana]
MVDLDQLQQIRDLLENIINHLEANELLPQPNPMYHDPLEDLGDSPASSDVTEGSNSDED